MIRNYLAAGRMLHWMTCIELAALSFVAHSVNAGTSRILVFAALGLLTIFTQLDARSRYQEFKKVRDQLILFGVNRRIFKSVSGSRCQRGAALAAARQLGVAKQCSDYFRAVGYRWYHLTPDFLARQPETLLSTGFWRATFFLPTYRSRCPMETPMPDGGDCEALSGLTEGTSDSIVCA